MIVNSLRFSLRRVALCYLDDSGASGGRKAVHFRNPPPVFCCHLKICPGDHHFIFPPILFPDGPRKKREVCSLPLRLVREGQPILTGLINELVASHSGTYRFAAKVLINNLFPCA